MKLKLVLIVLLVSTHAVSSRCRRWLGKCVKNSDCCNNRRCMNWGRCSLLHRSNEHRPKVYKCFENNKELISGVIKYQRGNETEKNLVKGIYGTPIGTWCVDYVTDFKSVFDGEFDLGYLADDISDWNTSSATKMEYMFSENNDFNQDISGWDVSKVTNMDHMFYDAKAFTQDISSWDVSKVTNFFGMFIGASNFNQDISSWNVSSATNIARMFERASSFDRSLCQWGTKISMNVYDDGIFEYSGCPNKNDPVYEGNRMKICCQQCFY
jgi:surface protein